ncbi:GNAT family N-acetyltransferase [Herbiconiux sp. CPCC 205716]|uniref:GNAT family N-acetyltransferase n=1 Tax=Herbiconiux gentiana TaxID=2970912 RepID=A0ABT2GA00_9MICO|nr:GNAT family N-acetyltransferase [Herbiconiux gentiana]MCS5713020.1 GNAT family N-acetyltransferase [Herbiconiux gentiana]
MPDHPFRDLLPLDLGGGLTLELRTRDGAAAAHELTMRNLDRLRQWEPWAQPAQSLAATRAFTDFVLALHEQGKTVPALIVRDGHPIGSISLKIDPATAIGELGYWIDAAHERQGVVTLAAAALCDAGFARGLERLEIRAAAGNTRSRAVAERLGFRLEGVLREALPVGATRHDLAVYGRLPADGATPASSAPATAPAPAEASPPG